MGRIFRVELEGKIYSCRFCHTHLALAEDLISRVLRIGQESKWQEGIKIEDASETGSWELVEMPKSFHCRRGKAYLFNNVANTFVGGLEERMMLSGMHTVADIFCCFCGENVGWKYVAAHMKSQKYKEGKFVLERGRILDGVGSEYYIDTDLHGSDPDDN